MQALVFNGRGGEYFRIWIVNLLLTIVTLSVYHPWAKVRTRRYFLGSTTLAGRAFDYHATGRQLLPGYLVLLVLVVLFVILQTVFPVAGAVLVVVLALVVPWIVCRSIGFNMRVTSYSTVRFGFAGGVGGAYVSYLLWPLLWLATLVLAPAVGGALLGSGAVDEGMAGWLILVLGVVGYGLAFVLYAAMKARQAHYVIDGYRYGQGRFATAVRARGFARILLKTIGLALLVALIVIALIAAGVLASGTAGQLLPAAGSLDDPEALGEALADGPASLVLGLLYAGMLLGALALAAYAYTRQRAYLYANSHLDGTIGFASTLGARRYAWVLLTNLLLVVVTLGLGIPWARVRLARTLAEHTEVDTRTGIDEYVTRQSREHSPLGEQIGDAFDVGAGIGL